MTIQHSFDQILSDLENYLNNVNNYSYKFW